MRDDSRLQQALESYVVLLDTSFAMQGSFGAFLRQYENTLVRNHIFVPYKVVQELEAIRARKDSRQSAAEHSLSLLQDGQKHGLLEFRRDAADDHVINDAVLSRVVEQLLPRRSVLVLTHDSNLTSYLYSKTAQQCFGTKDLVVAGVSAHGWLFQWNGSSGGGAPRAGIRSSRPTRLRPTASPGPRPFALTRALAPSLGKPLAASRSLREGSSLFLKDGTRITLSHVLASGGEGTIYEMGNSSLLCKVYHQNKLTVDRQEKIELMLTREVKDPTICWPQAAVYDDDRVFRGFVMPRADSQAIPLGHSLFIPARFSKMYPTWTRRESVALAATIVQKIKYLHDMNVLIGDINPLNILMKNERNVYLVDCDSYQVEGYPCPVGTVNFTAPEIQGGDCRTFLRTREHELFSVATLLFMIFMPGKCPYSHQGGEDGMANIRKMHFPYALGERNSDGAPEGPWRLCWSHLPYTIKEAFDQCFHESHRNQQRVSIEHWLILLGKHARDLNKQDMTFHGPSQRLGFDLAILPANLRRVMKDGEVRPPWRNDGLTDRDRMVQRLVTEANGSRHGALAGGTASHHTSAASPASAAGRSTIGSVTSSASMTPVANVPPTTRRGWSTDLKWVFGILTLAAIGASGCLVWYYWDPIIEFLKGLLCIGAAIVVIAIILISLNN